MSAFRDLYKDDFRVNQLVTQISKKENLNLHIDGLTGSSTSMVLSAFQETMAAVNLIVLPEKEIAAYFYNDMLALDGDKRVLFFPSSFKRSAQYGQAVPENVVRRAETLTRVSGTKGRLSIITYPDALVEKVINRKELKENTLEIKEGDSLSMSFICEMLDEYGFQQSDFAYEPGQYAVRGSLVDIFSFAYELPIRIDFFGDDIESLRTFDVETQLSKDKVKKVKIIPDIRNSQNISRSAPILSYLPSNSVVWVKDLNYTVDRMNAIITEVERSDVEDRPALEVLMSGFNFKDTLNDFNVVEFGHKRVLSAEESIHFTTVPQPPFNKNFDLLASKLLENSNNEYKNIILSSSKKQFERLDSIFDERGRNVKFEPESIVLHEGFTDSDKQTAIFTDHQIFERYHKYKLNDRFTKKNSLTIKELTSLNPGDYVVHIDHGIGVFSGLQRMEVNGKMQETIRLTYRDSDVLYVSIHSLHRISKYKGKDGEPPKIYKLGTKAWANLKQKTKSRVKDIAKELIALYAARKAQKGFAFSPDSYLQKELEASFLYEDTPDQEKATNEVKESMESLMPMDRLVCGDVGFGKTEIAIRAAFKAVADSKQVAVLVPTTILAMQHYRTFVNRLKDMPCNIEYISRLRKPKEVKETLKRVAEGKVDILIGTHKIVGKDVKFKDLGLLIIDEEQRFGVAVKDKLKRIRVNVDTLTLTATPIPRTLQFSLMGARDLSIMNTAPPNRHPIITEVHSFNESIIREAIEYEVSRGGQVFFVHNRVQNIAEVEAMVNRVCPGVRTVHAHGQMDSGKLEGVILDFMGGLYDVLIATTIIESGVDIPNANTIIINNAHNFGLSALHQLRGRVGRSNKKAFAYMLAPSELHMTPEARRRIKAIEDFSELGSGFNIAMQDLDIRGAGNMLGGEQSGFIGDIGFETYQKILDEAMLELKETDFKNLFKEDNTNSTTETIKLTDSVNIIDNIGYVIDCQIDTDMELLFPDDYISNVSERIRLYRELDNLHSDEDISVFVSQIEDRFGEMPRQTQELVNIVKLRRMAMSIAIEKLIMKNRVLIAHFTSNTESPFYSSPSFTKMLGNIQKHRGKFVMKESKGRLTLRAENVYSVSESLNLIGKLTE